MWVSTRYDPSLPQPPLSMIEIPDGHVHKLAEEVKKGIESTGAKVDVFLFPESESCLGLPKSRWDSDS
jgi:hypothetical protein